MSSIISWRVQSPSTLSCGLSMGPIHKVHGFLQPFSKSTQGCKESEHFLSHLSLYLSWEARNHTSQQAGPGVIIPDSETRESLQVLYLVSQHETPNRSVKAPVTHVHHHWQQCSTSTSTSTRPVTDTIEKKRKKIPSSVPLPSAVLNCISCRPLTAGLPDDHRLVILLPTHPSHHIHPSFLLASCPLGPGDWVGIFLAASPKISHTRMQVQISYCKRGFPGC
ncbi:hypothetical protein BJX76DRAFT_108386 [Aspergillus varians]